MPFARILAVATLVFAAQTAGLTRAAYTFTQITDSATLIDPFNSTYGIDGDVVTYTTRTGQVVRYHHGARSILFQSNVPARYGTFRFTPTNTPSFGAGTIGLTATRDDVLGVYRISEQGAATIALDGVGVTLAGLSTKTATSGPNVAFTAVRNGAVEVLVGDGADLKTIARPGASTRGGPIGSFANLAISGNRVAFTAASSGGYAVVAGDGASLNLIAQVGDPISGGSLGGMDINVRPAISESTVAFRGTYHGGWGVFAGNGGPLTTIAKTGDPAPVGKFVEFGSLPQQQLGISGSTVAFYGLYGINPESPTGVGIFTGKGGPVTAVIKSGDPLFGDTLGSVYHGPLAMDPQGSGRILFTYRLATGEVGLAMATPVPEPNALTLAATTLALIIRRRRAHIRRPAQLSAPKGRHSIARGASPGNSFARPNGRVSTTHQPAAR
jgi:hypothetical protein